MAAEEATNTNCTESSRSSLPFLEITCKSSGKIRRFSVGTKAGFALQLINRKLGVEVVPGSYIEAVKEGEEAVSFGPSSVLVDYGDGWRLQTVVDGQGLGEEKVVQKTYAQFTTVMGKDGVVDPEERSKEQSKLQINIVYLGKILLAFIVIFLLGGIFTWGLENLPRAILFINSIM